MSRRLDRWLRRYGLLKLAVLAFLLPFIVISFAARPAYDDFGYATVGRGGLWAAQATYYSQWTGRFTATLVQTALPRWFGLFAVYPWVALVVLVLFVLAFSLAMAALSGSCGWRGAHGWWAAGLLAVYLARIPVPVEAFWWLAGSVTYTGSVILAVFALAVWLRHPSAAGPDGWPPRWWQVAGFGLLMTLAQGCSELISVIFLPLTLELALFGWCCRRPALAWRWLLAAVLVVPGFLLVVLAPGNYVRATHFVHPAMIHALRCAAGSAAGELAGWCREPLSWGSGLVVLTGALVLARAQRPRWRVQAWHLGVLILSLYALTAAVHTIFWWAENSVPVNRVRNVLWLLFLVHWYLLAFALAQYWCAHRRQVPWPRLLRAARLRLLASGVLQAVVALFLLGSATSTFAVVMHDLRVTVPAWQAEYDARLRLIAAQHAAGQDVIVLPLFAHHPIIVGYIDIQPGDHDVNRLWASYFEVKHIIGVPTPPAE